MDVIFFAINIAARGDLRRARYAFERFPINMIVAAYLLENTTLVLSRGEEFAPYF